MKRIIIADIILLSSAFAFAEGVREDFSSDNVYKIGISKLFAHPALDAIEEGIRDYLATTPYFFEYNTQNANGGISAQPAR